ncbi:MAG: major capsid protein [Campylobacter sp.]|nr:major capsid protein [Campylobacter sp.]
MALSDMKVFSEYLMGTAVETLSQDIEKFNQASGGAIVLNAKGFDGDFMQESFFKGVHSAQRRVDRYAANNAATTTTLKQEQLNGVKIAGGFGPVVMEPSQMSWIQKEPAQALEVISRNMSQALMGDMINTAISALVAALVNTADVVADVSASGGINYSNLNNAHAKFGDRSAAIIANVMTGSVYHKLIGQNLANAARLFEAGGVLVVDILGKKVVVTDAPALYKSGTPNKDYVLGLTSGAAIVSDASDLITNIQTNNGKQRIETTYQVDYTYGLSLKGYAWDISSGGKSPSDAKLATGTNWQKVVASIKDTAGVLLIGDSTKG